MKFTDRTEADRIKIDAIFDKCRSIYHTYGGYEYNDETDLLLKPTPATCPTP